MQSSKIPQSHPARRPSGPLPVSTRQSSEPAQPSGTSATPAAKLSAATLLKPQPAPPSPTTEQTEPPVGELFKAPLVMTPIAKIAKGPRRSSRPEVPLSERPLTWDPDHYNPDGSLRTMHKLPGFDESYAEAMKARYIRHSVQYDSEKELSLGEIFGKKDHQ